MNIRILSFSGLLLSLLAAGSASAAPFADVPHAHWAAPAVQRIVAKKIMAGGPDGNFHGEKPVTRYELAVALDRFVTYIEAGRKPLHPMKAKIIPPASVSAPPNARAAMSRLAGNGFLPAGSPLFKGSGTEKVTAQQLSEALAQVSIRLSDRSLPPTKN